MAKINFAAALIVLSTTVCTGSPKKAYVDNTSPLVQLPISLVDDGHRGELDIKLAHCANFGTPHKGVDLRDKSKIDQAMARAKECVANTEEALRNGHVTDMPAMANALRGVSFTLPDGTDLVAETSARIISQIVTHKGQSFFDYRANPNSGVTPITKPFDKEITTVITRNGHKVALPDMVPNRTIPIDPSTAYIMGTADVLIHPAAYTAPGKTFAQTLASLRKTNTPAQDHNRAVGCMLNIGGTDILECVSVAARNAGDLIVKGQAPSYDRSLYDDEAIAVTAPVQFKKR